MLRETFHHQHAAGLLLLNVKQHDTIKTHEVAPHKIHYTEAISFGNKSEQTYVAIGAWGNEQKQAIVNMPVECFRVFYQLATDGHVIDLTAYCYDYHYKDAKYIKQGDELYKKIVALSPQPVKPEELFGAPRQKKIKLVKPSTTAPSEAMRPAAPQKEKGYSADFWRKEQKKLRQSKNHFSF